MSIITLMTIKGLGDKLNAFRLIQVEIDNSHSSRGAKVLNVSNVGLLLIAAVATISTVDIALSTNRLWVALITLGVQTIAMLGFFIEPKLDAITVRLLLTSYLAFYVVVLFFSNGSVIMPPYWSLSFILFTFVAAGGKEAFVWSFFHAGVMAVSVYKYRTEPFAPSTNELRLFGYVYLLTLGFSFLLDYATKLTSKRAFNQNKRLEETNARYDIILNSVGDGLVATDERGIIEFANTRALELLKMTRQQLLGQPLTAVIISKDSSGRFVPHHERPITKVLNQGETVTLNQTSKERYYFVRGDGEEFPVGMICSPVKVLNQIRGSIMLFHDISVEDQIDRAKSEFVSLASHQLRTPLNVITWYVEKLLSKRKGSLNISQESYLAEIKNNSGRMIRLVSDLLNVSRVELGRIKVKFEPVNLNTLIEPLIKEIEPLMIDKKMSMTKDITLPSGGVLEKSDESIVTVIIQNLLSNAVKYTPEGGSIHLFVGEQPNIQLPDEVLSTIKANSAGVYISVKDTGIGIPASQQAKIFSKLFRAENVQSLDVSGTGLGLYVTQSFANALGGVIWFNSIEGQGSTFTVFLPYTNTKATGVKE